MQNCQFPKKFNNLNNYNYNYNYNNYYYQLNYEQKKNINKLKKFKRILI